MQIDSELRLRRDTEMLLAVRVLAARSGEKRKRGRGGEERWKEAEEAARGWQRGR